MSKLRMIGLAGLLLTMGTLILAVPGCGGEQPTNPDGSIKAVPPTNPAPGSMEPEKAIPGS
jgi:hypothetical protein